ncbi:MAG: tyrosine-type recombinase/integrase [Bacteroidales bacterium]|nr:tyrosine-type recombinase/integrase [Bacteroidales bacterium]
MERSIYLTQHEIDAIFNLDLSSLPQLDLARDIFLVGCYTARRFSDYSRIKSSNITTLENGVTAITLVQQKTKGEVIIPIRPELNKVLEKYGYNLPLTHEQKVNKHIKEVGEKAKINEIIEVESIKGGFRVKEKKTKFKLIVTHTARRSACTNMYNTGIAPLDIMQISGHKTEKEFLKYIKFKKKKTAMKLAKKKFFIGNNLKVSRQ